MKTHIPSTGSLAAVIFASVFLTAAPAFGDPPEGKGKGRDRGEERHSGNRDNDGERGGKKLKKHDKQGEYFRDEQKVVIREYYGERFREGRCPPGLAKKNNGCMPPGQAKKWRIGQPLERTVVVYEVPQPVVMQLGPPPSGHKYVRVAADILLIAIGTGMVVDAIQDLNRL